MEPSHHNGSDNASDFRLKKPRFGTAKPWQC
jgi:hypothetical protein